MLDLLRPWFRLNVLEFEPYMAAHARFLVYGDFVRLSFLNWLLPELHARGWRTELLNRGGDQPAPAGNPGPRHTSRRPSCCRPAHRRPCRRSNTRSASHNAHQPTPARNRRPGIDSRHQRCAAIELAGEAGSSQSKALAPVLVVLVAVLLWLPRQVGPIDLRWDGGVYYLLGTALAEGRGYRLLNEPGEIEARAVPATAARRRRTSPVGSRDERPDNRRPMASPVVVPRLRGVRSGGAVVAHAYLPPARALLGALLSMFCLHAWFLSDALFPEVWFSVATVLFLIFARTRGNRAHSVLAYVCALASYALRTVGIAAFAVWVFDSLIRRRFREALIRAVLVLLPVAGWQAYVASVERSEAYKHPAYEYQRAPYLFYNVSYARNVVLRDPFTPEKGQVRIVRRIVRGALDLPATFGGTLSASRGYLQMFLWWALGEGPIKARLITWGVFILLSMFGMVITGGILLLLFQRHSLVPLYLLAYSAAICLTPFPEQYERYLMPVAPLLALAAIVCLDAAAAWRHRPARAPKRELPLSVTGAVLGTALLMQMAVTVYVYVRQYRPIAYVDARGESLAYKLFYYNESQRGFDEAVEYVRAHADAAHVVAAGTPHWIHLRTGLKTVMPPFERDVDTAQRLLDSVPVRYLVIGRDVVATERYTVPVVQRFADRWEAVHATEVGGWIVYRRVAP